MSGEPTTQRFTVRAEHAVAGGRIRFCEHESALTKCPMRFSVFEPASASGSSRAPVLYYLAGLTCNEETFAFKGAAYSIANRLGLAIVTMDTSPRGERYPGDDASWDFGVGAGFYVDATEEPWARTYKMWSWVTKELRDLVEAEFSVDAERRGIFGHSMGGHGALTIGLTLPEDYRSVSAFAPIVGPMDVPWGQKAFGNYLGSDRTTWAKHDACALVKSGRKHASTLLVDQGLSDKFLERELQPERFEAACNAAGQSLSLRKHAGYDHSYFFIATFVEDHLEHHARLLRG